MICWLRNEMAKCRWEGGTLSDYDAVLQTSSQPNVPNISSATAVANSPSKLQPPHICPQPEQSIQEYLLQEVKIIYADLVLLEAKCVEVDTSAASSTGPPAPPLDWRSLMDLHCKLLYKHYEFFLTSQHLSAKESLQRRALHHHLPARMWQSAFVPYSNSCAVAYPARSSTS